MDEGTSMEGASIFMALAGKQAANGETGVVEALIENWHLSDLKNQRIDGVGHEDQSSQGRKLGKGSSRSLYTLTLNHVYMGRTWSN